MCVKLSPKSFNSGLYPSYPTNTYTCGETIVPRMYSGIIMYSQNIVPCSLLSVNNSEVYLLNLQFNLPFTYCGREYLIISMIKHDIMTTN